jgi:hypothetical protein
MKEEIIPVFPNTHGETVTYGIRNCLAFSSLMQFASIDRRASCNPEPYDTKTFPGKKFFGKTEFRSGIMRRLSP